MSIQKYLNEFVHLDEIEFDKLNAEERMHYQHSLKHYRDLRNCLKYAREEGFEKGEEKGKEEGRQEGKEEVVKKSILKGLSFTIISTITGLSIEEIQKIADSL
jgi:predicted transposase/invertase (TIGR01784 family)